MLDVSNNNLSGLVNLTSMGFAEWSSNTNLRSLNASHNYLSSISSFNYLSSLAELDFQGCTYNKDLQILSQDLFVTKNDRIREQKKRLFFSKFSFFDSNFDHAL